MNKRLLIITQAVDANDDHRAAFLDWIREFSKHAHRVDVIAVTAGVYDVPKNVYTHSLGKERGANKFLQAFRFYWLLCMLVPRSDGIFAYASPIFVNAAWPVAVLFRVPIVLWYLHRKTTLKLRLAVLLCKNVVTADTTSLTIRSKKIIAVGHGISTERFAFPARRFDISNRPLRIVSVGRIAPIKNLDTLIRAVALLRERGQRVEVRIIGQANLPEHHSEKQRLWDLVSTLGLTDSVEFTGFVPYHGLPEQYHWADIVVGCTPRGGIDKAILEGMAAGCIAITSNDAMRSTLEPYADELIFQHGNAKQLADRISSVSQRSDIRDATILNVRRFHHLKTAVERISALL